MAQTAPIEAEERDDLDEYLAEQTARNPEFPRLVEEATERKRLIRSLAAARKDAHLSQTTVAARMRTSASAVARLERGEMNTTLATLQRYAAAVGKRLEWQLVEAASAGEDAHLHPR